jgi:hypothetical protein
MRRRYARLIEREQSVSAAAVSPNSTRAEA